MSTDSQNLQEELMTITRELKGAGEAAVGNINPAEASGTAILAVQQANEQPLIEQTVGLKSFIEDLVRIWLDGWITYSDGGLEVYEEVTEMNPETQQQETMKRPKKIPLTVLEGLKATIRVDITPTGAYDRYAVELSLQNLFSSKQITFDEYVKALPNGSVMPKTTLEGILVDRKESNTRNCSNSKTSRFNAKSIRPNIKCSDDQIDANAPIMQVTRRRHNING